jgi:predicted helicase
MNNIVIDYSHPMASSNTGDSRVFRNSVGNYISRKAYLELLSTKEGCVSHKYLSPNESAWLMGVR